MRVLEVGGAVSVAYAGRLLAALGADIVHVAEAGDDSLRAQGPLPETGGGSPGFYSYLHMGKRILQCDTGASHDEGPFRQLLETADLLIVGASHKELEARGLTSEVLADVAPGVASVAISPFGQEGPYRDYQATDLLEFLIFGRFSDSGLAGRPPIGYSLHAAELYAGTISAVAGLAAVRHTRRTGVALHGDISSAHCILASPDRAYTAYAFHGAPLPRPEAHREVFVISSDGRLVMINTGLGWERTAAMLGQPELVDDPRFVTLAARMVHSDELFALVLEWAARHTVDEIVAALAKHRVMGAPLYEPHEVLDDPHYRERDAFDPLALPDVETIAVPAAPFKVDGKRPRLDAPHYVQEPEWLEAADRRPEPTKSAQPLEGIRVLDLGELYAGPHGCSLLGDLGADVIKVENIQRMPAVVRGDRHPPSEAYGYWRGEPGEPAWERFHLFHNVERNKRGITLDVKSDRGRDLFLRLVRQSHAVISNYTPRALRELRITPAHLSAASPQLSFVHLPGFGADGPYSDRVSVGPVTEALSGHWAVRGYSDAPELQSNQVVWSDAVAGGMAAVLALAGIVGSEHGLPGTWFDVSQAEALTCFVAPEIIDWGWNRRPAVQYGDKHPFMCPHGSYPAQGSDRWVVIAARDGSEWLRLAAAIERPDLATDPALMTVEGRKRSEGKIDAAIAAWTSERSAHELMTYLQDQGVPCVVALHDDEIAGDPQVQAREMLETVSHPLVGDYLNPSTPLRFAQLPRIPRRPPNLLGEHNVEILTKLGGVTDSELGQLQADGIIGTRFV